MTLTLTDSLGARMGAAAAMLGISAEELAEWFLADDLKRIESIKTHALSPEQAQALRAKIHATPLLIVDNATQRTLNDRKKTP